MVKARARSLTVIIFTDQWNIVTSILTDRWWPVVAALNNKIYVTGGYDDGLQPMSRVDCYDPDTNTRSQVANMNIARCDHSLVSLHGRLYAIGGTLGVDNDEVYDPDNNTWTLLQHKLDGNVSVSGACLIRKYHISS